MPEFDPRGDSELNSRFRASGFGGARAWALLGLCAGLCAWGGASASVRASAGGDEPEERQGPAGFESFNATQTGHWSFRPVERPEPPAVKNAGWARNPIDAFILETLEEVEIPPSAEADKRELLRRATFDLTGLPPTPEEIRDFLADDSPDAFEKVVDRLLASPRYGERWAQHWLDLAHYGDSNGFELDADRPDMWRYRDWVIRALNADMPYDEFLTLQIAGDQARPGDADALIATGFARCGPREVVSGNIDPVVKRQSELTEITDTVGSVFLGLTMGCARCHDHKFDPIPTTDYYRLQSFFAGSELVEEDIASKEEKEAHNAAKAEVDARIAPLRAEMAELEKPYRAAIKARKEAGLRPEERAVLAIPADQRTPEQKKLAAGVNTALKIDWHDVYEEVRDTNPEDFARREELKRKIHELELTKPAPPAKATAIKDKHPAPETRVYARGDTRKPGVAVGPRPPGVVLAASPGAGFDESSLAPPAGSGIGAPGKEYRRLALARWMTNPANPLTARVMVNRLWKHHFGRGIAATPSDFGIQGEPPTHPELLDWLASEFVASGWRLKAMHRLMMTSSTYRQTSRIEADSPGASEDPDNLLLWRMNRRRLEAEAIRDATLAVSGEIHFEAGGPGVRARLEPEIEELIFTEAEEVDLWAESTDPAQLARRSIYLFRKRNVRYPMFDAFDAPDTLTACPSRSTSTHALQALILMNSEFAAGRARVFAGRLLTEEPDDAGARVARGFELAFGRPPSVEETERALEFVRTQTEFLRDEGDGRSAEDAEADAWVDFAMALLNSNEFVYVR